MIGDRPVNITIEEAETYRRKLSEMSYNDLNDLKCHVSLLEKIISDTPSKSIPEEFRNWQVNSQTKMTFTDFELATESEFPKMPINQALGEVLYKRKTKKEVTDVKDTFPVMSFDERRYTAMLSKGSSFEFPQELYEHIYYENFTASYSKNDTPSENENTHHWYSSLDKEEIDDGSTYLLTLRPYTSETYKYSAYFHSSSQHKSHTADDILRLIENKYEDIRVIPNVYEVYHPQLIKVEVQDDKGNDISEDVKRADPEFKFVYGEKGVMGEEITIRPPNLTSENLELLRVEEYNDNNNQTSPKKHSNRGFTTKLSVDKKRIVMVYRENKKTVTYETNTNYSFPQETVLIGDGLKNPEKKYGELKNGIKYLDGWYKNGDFRSARWKFLDEAFFYDEVEEDLTLSALWKLPMLEPENGNHVKQDMYKKGNGISYHDGLRVQYVSDFDFGTVGLNNQRQTRTKSKKDTILGENGFNKEVAPFISIIDERPQASPWELHLKFNYFHTKYKEKGLLGIGNRYRKYEFKAPYYLNVKPNEKYYSLDENSLQFEDNKKVEVNTPTKIISSDLAKEGSWTVNFGEKNQSGKLESNIELVIPQNTKSPEYIVSPDKERYLYTSTLEWQLSVPIR